MKVSWSGMVVAWSSRGRSTSTVRGDGSVPRAAIAWSSADAAVEAGAGVLPAPGGAARLPAPGGAAGLPGAGAAGARAPHVKSTCVSFARSRIGRRPTSSALARSPPTVSSSLVNPSVRPDVTGDRSAGMAELSEPSVARRSPPIWMSGRGRVLRELRRSPIPCGGCSMSPATFEATAPRFPTCTVNLAKKSLPESCWSMVAEMVMALSTPAEQFRELVAHTGQPAERRCHPVQRSLQGRRRVLQVRHGGDEIGNLHGAHEADGFRQH